MGDIHLTQEPEFEPPAKAREPVFREYLQALGERWWLIAIIFLIALVHGYFKLSKIKAVYGASSVLLIEQRGAQVMRGVESSDQSDQGTLEVMNTMVETLHSRRQMQMVVDSLNLQDNPDFLPPNPGGAPHGKEEAVGRLLGSVRVSIRRSTRLVDIYVEHSNPEMARILADAVPKEFIRFGLQERINAARYATEFLSDEAGKYREKLRQSELALDKYRVTNNASSLESNQNFVLEQLKAVNGRLNAAQAERFSLEGDAAKADRVANKPSELMSIPGIARQPAVLSLSNGLAAKEAEFSMLSQQYKSKHPKYIAAIADIEGLRNKLHQRLFEAVGVLGADCKSAREYEERLAKAVEEQQAVTMDLDRKAIDYSMLKREAEANRTMYNSMVSRMTELDVSGGIDNTPIKIVENAVTPGGPILHNKVQSMVTSGLVGLGVGIVLVLGLMKLSPYLTTVAHVDRFIGVPVLGTVPLWKPSDGKMNLDFFNSDNHSFCEAFRSLRTAMLFQGKIKEPRTFMVTSAVLGEGKTFVSCNLGVAFAQAGTRTLLIDADLRKRAVSRRIFGKEMKPGLIEFLEGRATFEEILRPTEVENYFVITAGEFAKKPAELLKKNVLQPLIQTALQSFERIIVDTPPILAVSDSLIVAGDVDAVCLSVYSGKSHRLAVVQACNALSAVGIEPSGIILNALQERHSAYQYYSYGRNQPYGASRQEA